VLCGADGGEVVEEWTLLLLAAPASGYPSDGEHAGDELAAGVGLGPQTLFAPEDGWTPTPAGRPCAFGGIVGGLDAGDGDEGP
jgi:hypothetical protein